MWSRAATTQSWTDSAHRVRRPTMAISKPKPMAPPDYDNSPLAKSLAAYARAGRAAQATSGGGGDRGSLAQLRLAATALRAADQGDTEDGGYHVRRWRQQISPRR